MKKGKDVILGITAGISAYKSCELARNLKEEGFNVTVVMTKNAVNFVTPLTFKTLSGNRVYSDIFDQTLDWDPKHINLAQKADIIVVAPATADFIGKLANGICDDLLSCVCIAAKCKIILCPAMNTNMYENEIVQDNLRKLKKAGYIIAGPVKGRLACGDIGAGRMEKVENIRQVIKREI